MNDVDDAIDDVKWIKEHGLRGGILLPNVAPDVKWVKPLYDAYYDPLWKVCEDLEVPVNAHGGTGLPDYGRYAVAGLLYIAEVPFYSQRPFVQLLLSGVFERFPKLKFVMTEMGCAWIPPMLTWLDGILKNVRDQRAIGELRFTEDQILQRSATEYFLQNCWVGASQPGPADAAVRMMMGDDRFMWGSDYPHDEGTYPYTRAPASALPRHAGRRAPAPARWQRGEALRLRPRQARADRRHCRPDRRRTVRAPHRAPRRAQLRAPEGDPQHPVVTVVVHEMLARTCEMRLMLDLGDVAVIVPEGVHALRRPLIDAVTADDWQVASEGFGDPDLANE